MALLRGGSYGYSKVNEEDPEEMIHRRAQFLIYKVLQQADHHPRRPSFVRIKLCRLRVKIGRKLRKLRRSILISLNTARMRVYKQVSTEWKRLVGHGQAIGSLPAPIFP